MTGQTAPTGGEDDGVDRLDQLIRQTEELLASGEFQGALNLLEEAPAPPSGQEPTDTTAEGELRYRDLQSRHLALLRAHADLGVALRAAEALSEVDPLTGLYNRRYLEHFIPAVIGAEGEGSDACVAVLDLDDFKRVNDEMGYTAGDVMLREVGAQLQQLCRHGDGVVRLGGDEFIVVLRGTTVADGRRVLDRIRSTIADHVWSGIPESIRITTSIGFTAAKAASTPAQLIDEASQAMQHAKRTGRDRVSCWEEIRDASPERRSQT